VIFFGSSFNGRVILATNSGCAAERGALSVNSGYGSAFLTFTGSAVYSTKAGFA